MSVDSFGSAFYEAEGTRGRLFFHGFPDTSRKQQVVTLN